MNAIFEAKEPTQSSSESIGKLAEALAKAQGAMGGALKDSSNPFFKSKYADLESVWSACRKALSENSLAVVQTTDHADAGIRIITTLVHSSGEWVRGVLPIMAKDQTPQGIGSAITYARRYALAAIAGVYQTDDDAEAAHGRGNGNGNGKHHDPKEPDRTMEAQLLASNFKAAVESKDDGKIGKVHKDANGDQELYQLAWKLLDAPTRASIKNSLGRFRGDQN
jgi:hypothetical protein